MMWKNDWQTVLNAAVHHGTTNPWRRVLSMEYGCNPGWVWAVENMRTLCAWWSGDLPVVQQSFLFFFFWHFAFGFVVFLYHFLGCTCNTIVACRACEKRQQDTWDTWTRRQTRPFNGSPSARIACVCVCKCRTMTECQFIRCHNLWHQLLRRIAITNDSQRWVNCLSHIIILFCWFNKHNLIAYNWFHKSVFRACN